MNTKKIIFRADGNSLTGLGHLYRLLALVNMLENDFEYIFLTSTNSYKEIFEGQINFEVIPASVSVQDEPDWIFENFQTEKHIVILDGYDFGSDYQNCLHRLGFRIIYIDDLMTDHIYADIVVNHAISVQSNSYKTESYTKFALGSQYALLRPTFLQAAAIDRKIDKLETVLVCFGGSDPLDFTFRVVNSLIRVNIFKTIHVLIGAGYKHDKIYSLISSHSNISISQNLNEKDVFSLMQKCELAIVPSSTILYELCAIKMYVFSGYYVENQQKIYNGFLQQGAIEGLGNLNELSMYKFEEQLLDFSESWIESNQLKNQTKLFDSGIKERFVKLVKSIC